MTSDTDAALERDVDGDVEGDAGMKAAAAGGVLGALAMTSCCILPLALFSLGATGAWIGRLGALNQYKWIFFIFAGASIAYGFWKVHRADARACADGTCARPVNQRIMKTALWSATAVVSLSLAFPYIAPLMLGY